MAAAICTPVDCCGPVIGSSAPILTVPCACAPATAALNASAARPTIATLRSMMFSSPHQPRPESALSRASRRTSFETPCFARLLRMRSANSIPFRSDRFHGIAPLRMRLPARVDDRFDLAQCFHARHHLRKAAIGLALFLDCRDELAILELDSVHGYVDFGEVDLILLAVEQIIVIGVVGAIVADVAEERAERAVIVERQRQGQD